MTRRAAALALCLVLAVLAAGCSAESLDAVLEAAGDVYDKYGRPSVSMAESDPFYGHRHDFSHEAWAGEGSMDAAPSDGAFTYADASGTEADTRGRASSSYGIVTDPWTAFAPDPDDGSEPGGWHQAEYPGICPGGVLYRRIGLPGGAVVTGTAYLQGSLSEACGTFAGWLESYPEGGLYVECRMFYDGGSRVPEGILVSACDVTGSFRYCRYFWNVQPGIAIDYTDGRSWVEAAGDPEAVPDTAMPGDAAQAD